MRVHARQRQHAPTVTKCAQLHPSCQEAAYLLPPAHKRPGRLVLLAAVVLKPRVAITGAINPALPCRCPSHLLPPRYAVGHIGCLILRGWLPTRIKASDLRGFVRKYRGQLLAAP